MLQMKLTTFIAVFLSIYISYVQSESTLILGGEIDDLIHPSISEVEAFGSCGMFEHGVPKLPHDMRDDAAVMYGNLAVICGGYHVFGPSKECYSLELSNTTQTLEWKKFPSMITSRYMHGLVVVGGDLYAVGGSKFIGTVSTIEKFNHEKQAWEKFGEMNGVRYEFCTLSLTDHEIILIGGYDEFLKTKRAEKYDVTTKTWTQLTSPPVGRVEHACTWHNDDIVVAGGWVPNTINNDTEVIATNTVVKYSPGNDTWTALPNMNEDRTLFGLVSLNGILTAIGGWRFVEYSPTLESFNEDLQSWEFDATQLSQAKGAFSVVDSGDFFADIECQNRF